MTTIQGNIPEFRDDDTLVSLFERSAHRHARKRLTFPEQNICFSYNQLHEVATGIAVALRDGGLGVGNLVGLLFPTSPDFLAAFFGVLGASRTAVPLPQPAGLRNLPAYLERLQRILADGGIQHIIVGGEFEAATTALLELHEGIQVLRVPELLAMASGRGAGFDRVRPGQLALVQYTSGSTSEPKGVALTHEKLRSGLHAIIDGIRLSSDDVNGQWLPLHHDMGLIGTLAGIVSGVDHYLWSPLSFIRGPHEWLREFSRCRASIYAGPSFSYAKMLEKTTDAVLSGLDLSAWRVAFNGAEPISAATMRAFMRRFGPVGFRASTMFPVYGLAEATLAVSFPVLGEAPFSEPVECSSLADTHEARPAQALSAGTREVVAVGRAVLGHELRVTGPGRVPVPPRHVGQIEVRGPAVMDAYYGKSATGSGMSPDGWFPTGDLGYLSEGRLFVTGRSKEMIIVRGANYYPQDVEAVVSEVPGVHRGNVVAFALTDGPEERMGLMVEVADSHQDALGRMGADIRGAILKWTGLSAVEIYFVMPRTILRTTSGKYQRLLMREMAAGGTLGNELLSVDRAAGSPLPAARREPA